MHLDAAAPGSRRVSAAAKLHIKEITAKKRDAELDEELSAVRA